MSSSLMAYWWSLGSVVPWPETIERREHLVSLNISFQSAPHEDSASRSDCNMWQSRGEHTGWKHLVSSAKRNVSGCFKMANHLCIWEIEEGQASFLGEHLKLLVKLKLRLHTGVCWTGVLGTISTSFPLCRPSTTSVVVLDVVHRQRPF